MAGAPGKAEGCLQTALNARKMLYTMLWGWSPESPIQGLHVARCMSTRWLGWKMTYRGRVGGGKMEVVQIPRLSIITSEEPSRPIKMKLPRVPFHPKQCVRQAQSPGGLEMWLPVRPAPAPSMIFFWTNPFLTTWLPQKVAGLGSSAHKVLCSQAFAPGPLGCR